MLSAVASGTVTLANAPGNGIGDDKAVYAYVPNMIRYYLGETPALAHVPTYLCGDADQCHHVLDHLDELVVKPVDGYGGKGVALTRVAPQGSLIVNSSRGGGAKDTWILSASTASAPTR